jgi:hypothetical protein
MIDKDNFVKYQCASIRSKLLLLGLALTVGLLSGCATTTGASQGDPYERMNRKVFNFNQKLDRWFLRPVAKAYDAILPDVVSKGVSNFFANLDDISTLMNDLLQFKRCPMPGGLVSIPRRVCLVCLMWGLPLGSKNIMKILV